MHLITMFAALFMNINSMHATNRTILALYETAIISAYHNKRDAFEVNDKFKSNFLTSF
jgi:hypothetical protein